MGCITLHTLSSGAAKPYVIQVCFGLRTCVVCCSMLHEVLWHFDARHLAQVQVAQR
jgi:hypothetical protein